MTSYVTSDVQVAENFWVLEVFDIILQIHKSTIAFVCFSAFFYLHFLVVTTVTTLLRHWPLGSYKQFADFISRRWYRNVSS